MFFFDQTMILLIPVLILVFYAQSKVKGNYNKFNQIRNNHNMTGAEVAKFILNKNGIYDVDVVEVRGVLTDHYNPMKKCVCLSSEVYHNTSISSISIASHEVGHAIQHAKNYLPLKLRAGVLPMANIGSNMGFPLFFLGMLFRLPFLMNLGIIFFGGALVFHLVTLPVEFNASSRAIKELNSYGLILGNEETGVKKVLNAAALTYVASTLMALIQLIRMLLIRGDD